MRELNTFAAFIFDLDGTLVNSEKYHVQAFAKAMKEMAGYNLTAEDEADFTGNTSLWLAKQLKDKHGLDVVPEEVLARKFECLYEVFRTEMLPGAADFVRRYAGCKRLGVASNSPGHFVSRVLSDSGLISGLDTVVTIDDVAKRKPDPEMVLLCLERLQVESETTLVFEDSRSGVDAALSAGCSTVFIDNGLFPLPQDLPVEVSVRTWFDLLECPVGEPS